jgi:hypothetical protein
VSWELFLGAHPDAAAALGLAGVHWNGEVFYTKAALASWLRLKGGSYAQWARSHVQLASALDPHTQPALRDRLLAFADPPRILAEGTVAVSVTGTVERATIIVRGPGGAVLGRAQAVRDPEGRMSAAVPLWGWSGQHSMLVTVKTETRNGLRQVHAWLTPAEPQLRRLSGGG